MKYIFIADKDQWHKGDVIEIDDIRQSNYFFYSYWRQGYLVVKENPKETKTTPQKPSKNAKKRVQK